ncbi:hypothetical protein D1007_27970 [Hordeum vulgare]|nr:hypothetical protein D1007_27970 [Hordeum vulgare]
MATKAPPRRWNTKRYILMALLGTLVGSGVVIAVSTILCPAVIVFVIVYLQYFEAATGTEFKVPADVDGPKPSPQLPGTTAKMKASANFTGSPVAQAGASGTPNISVLVLSVVRFNVGPLGRF